MLKSIDLFSGIGGITHALRGIAQPVAYCEIDEHAQAVLRKNMLRGNLPEAPICDDVRSLDRKWLRKHVGSSKADIVVGGFPCVGFSVAGSRDGLRNEASGLFYEMVRVADEARAPAIFMENVPHVLNIGMHAILEELSAHGFDDVRWCILSANDVGAPHLRKRWFCLALKSEQAALLHWSIRTRFTRFDWRNGTSPARTTHSLASAKRRKVRYMLLGNAVVPDAVRYAFGYLSSGFVRATFNPKNIARLPVLRHNSGRGRGSTTAVIPINGFMLGGHIHRAAPPRMPSDSSPSLSLMLIPTAFKPGKPRDTRIGVLLEKPLAKSLWATPTCSFMHPSNYLTDRNSRALGTQIRFERDTPNRLRGYPLNPAFVEWLMGYPKGWTIAMYSRESFTRTHLLSSHLVAP